MSTATTTRERPILFSSAMVRAILAGAKTQTRRLVRGVDPVRHIYKGNANGLFGFAFGVNGLKTMLCPFGFPGDRLWVRETWCVYKEYDAYPGGSLGFEDPRVHYCADFDDVRPPGFGRRRASRFMPRWASRITLEVEAVRVERIQDISHADAIAEGVVHVMGLGPASAIPAADFKKLWDELNANRGAGWAANPFVWVIHFRRVPT